MPDDRVDLILLRGTDDTDPRAPAFQADIGAFADGLRREGVRYSQRGMAFDAVDVMGYPLPEFVVAVTPIAVAVIGGVVDLVKKWMETRPGRGVRFKDGDRYVEDASCDAYRR